MKTPTTLRLSERTRNQLKTLSEVWGESQANVVATAVDRLYQQERENK